MHADARQVVRPADRRAPADHRPGDGAPACRACLADHDRLLGPEVQARSRTGSRSWKRPAGRRRRWSAETLQRKASAVLTPTETSAVGGVQPLVEIINRADPTTEKAILEGLAGDQSQLAEEVRPPMFVFADITLLEDRAIQLVLQRRRDVLARHRPQGCRGRGQGEYPPDHVRSAPGRTSSRKSTCSVRCACRCVEESRSPSSRPSASSKRPARS